MDKEHKKTLWLLLGVVAVFAGLLFMVTGRLDSLLSTVLPGFSTGPAMSVKKASFVKLEKDMDYKAKVNTTEGSFVIDLYELDTPLAVSNFVSLANKGFYDDLSFYRVIKDVLVQTGDPVGDGSGGPGYVFDDEIRSTPVVRGSVAMATNKLNSNGSQFFIVLKDRMSHLDRKQTVFGNIVEGIDVVSKISSVPTKDNGLGEKSKPVSDVLIKSIEIIKEPYK